MKVLKFGGSSVGTVPNMLRVKQIIESIDDEVIVVVSALGGITDKLIETSNLAVHGDAAYEINLEEIINRHVDMVLSIMPLCRKRDRLIVKLNDLFEELQFVISCVYYDHRLSTGTAARIVSYGERLSSLIVNSLIEDSTWFDARSFIKTEKNHGKCILSHDLTTRLICKSFQNHTKVSLVPGFISSDKESGETTNLGRGGSDYTASIIASTLNADILEIWTDVDGFMTADPRIISTAQLINELSYTEAINLCKYGAKVIYPPTLNPVDNKNIPVIIKNTMHPEAPGTIIKRYTNTLSSPFKGISSIKNSSLITINSFSMMQNEEIHQHIIKSMTDNGIDFFWFSKSSYSTSLTIGIYPEDEESACNILREAFNSDLKMRNATYHIQVEHNLSMITIVGENIRHALYRIDDLFNRLSHHGIKVISSSSEHPNKIVSFIIQNSSLNKAMNITHECLFETHPQSYSTAS